VLHLQEHALDAVDVGAVPAAPAGGAGRRRGLGAAGRVVQVVRGLLERRQPRLVGVAVRGGAAEGGVPPSSSSSSSSSSSGHLPATAGGRRLRLHHGGLNQTHLVETPVSSGDEGSILGTLDTLTDRLEGGGEEERRGKEEFITVKLKAHYIINWLD